jgi:nitrile hydratase
MSHDHDHHHDHDPDHPDEHGAPLGPRVACEGPRVAARREKGLRRSRRASISSSTATRRKWAAQRRPCGRAGGTDPAYKRRLLDDTSTAMAESGYTGRQGENMAVVENTPTIHNMVVRTLVLLLSMARARPAPGLVLSRRHTARVR